LYMILTETHTLFKKNKLFFLNLYNVYNLYILMDFYLALKREACPRSSRLNNHSVKRPSNYTSSRGMHAKSLFIYYFIFMLISLAHKEEEKALMVVACTIYVLKP
jgi:hypothetical protein